MLKKDLNEFNQFFNLLKNEWGILTAGDKNTGFNCLTVSWGGIGELWGKDVCFLFVRKSRYTHQFIQKSDSITLSFLTDEYKEAKNLLGTLSGRDIDKMKEAKLNYTYDPDFDGAYIEQCYCCLKMKKIYEINLPCAKLDEDILKRYYPTKDEHIMYVCEIKQYLVKEK